MRVVKGWKKVKSTHTDKELAKMAGVGIGTVARFNKVMNSGDEDLKKKVLANEVSINAGYKELTQSKEEKKTLSNLIFVKELLGTLILLNWECFKFLFVNGFFTPQICGVIFHTVV